MFIHAKKKQKKYPKYQAHHHTKKKSSPYTFFSSFYYYSFVTYRCFITLRLKIGEELFFFCFMGYLQLFFFFGEECFMLHNCI